MIEKYRNFTPQIAATAYVHESAVVIGKVKLALGIDNLFDRRVFLYGDGTGGGALPGAGRTAFIRLSTRVW